MTKIYNSIRSGELAGSASARQLPDIAMNGGLVCFVGAADNVGNVYLGAAGVTIPGGTLDDTTSGIPIAKGVMTGWFSVNNLNQFYIICDNAGDDLTYIIQG